MNFFKKCTFANLFMAARAAFYRKMAALLERLSSVDFVEHSSGILLTKEVREF